jgi:hypothetical protein
MRMAKTRHLQRIGYEATGLIGEILQLRRRVVVSDQYRILLYEHALDLVSERAWSC